MAAQEFVLTRFTVGLVEDLLVFDDDLDYTRV
jgi:hypothetical protein